MNSSNNETRDQRKSTKARMWEWGKRRCIIMILGKKKGEENSVGWLQAPAGAV